MVKLRVGAALVALVLAGCCNCAERYGQFLEQVEQNLREDVRPKYEHALRESGRPADLMENDLGLVDDTADTLRRVRTGGIGAWADQGVEGE